jgi:FAD:protein FMN transferase
VSVHRFTSMGCEIVVGGAEADADACDAIEALFAERDRTFSRFRTDSELNRVNESAGRAVRVSADFAAMLALALEVAQQTDELVVPTLGAELEAAEYGLEPDFARSRVTGLIGRHVLLPAGTQLDLNGVVKSKTVDDALSLLPGDGFVSAGGDIAVRGSAVVALPAGGSVQLVRGALATSGTDRRGHHLIDPRTGRPSRSRWLQVTACGATCVGADIAAKAAFLLDDAGPGWLDARGVPGRFVGADGSLHTNDAWERSLEQELACT